MIRFTCPHCNLTLKSPFGSEGRTATCRCGGKMRVPDAAAFAQSFAVSPLPAPRRKNYLPLISFLGGLLAVAGVLTAGAGVMSRQPEIPSPRSTATIAFGAVLLVAGLAFAIYSASQSPPKPPVPVTPESPFPFISALCAFASIVLVGIAAMAPLINANLFAMPALLLAFGSFGAFAFSPRGVAGCFSGLFSCVALLAAIIAVVGIQAKWASLPPTFRL